MDQKENDEAMRQHAEDCKALFVWLERYINPATWSRRTKLGPEIEDAIGALAALLKGIPPDYRHPEDWR